MRVRYQAARRRRGDATGRAWAAAAAIACGALAALAADSSPSLSPGVRAVWDLGRAQRESTPTRERVCINGLWRWQPAAGAEENVPAGNWGYFKVPGSWPGITDYMQKDCQTVFPEVSWKGTDLGRVTAAWYQREVSIPAEWAGRRVLLSVEYLNSLARVFVDGKPGGDLRFPGGELDVTALCRPGATHLLSLRVAALPLKGVMLSYGDSANARQVEGRVARRGLCGDVFLAGEPAGPRLTDVKVDTSVRNGEITFSAALAGLAPDVRYTLRARVAEPGRPARAFDGPAFGAADASGGRVAFAARWRPERLWDVHTPSNTLSFALSLHEAGGRALDEALPVRFGFREFWIDGRDFYLNGTRLFLCALPLDNAQVGAAWASYAGARETMRRLKGAGINFVYTHNYGCEPGTHLGFAEILRAADDVGMLVGFSQPHFGQYDWDAADADTANRYAEHAVFYVRAAQNHPSVVAYAMSHNATGYSEDMNPDMIDGLRDARDTWALRNAGRAMRAEAIVRRLDPGRIVYHHASGNLGAMHTSNFYPNFVPVQEMSDWFGHWATNGVKPLFLCEYGAPFTWDWTMYRGWYKGKREFGSAVVPWEFCLAEWNAQFLGDAAYRISEAEKENLRWEAGRYRAKSLWHRWDYPHAVGSRDLDEVHPVLSQYLGENWRAFRARGVSAVSPWEFGVYWTLRGGVDKGRRALPVEWENLQRPGFSADFLEARYERMDLAYEAADWIPTATAAALLRNNGPLLAYLAGKPSAFTGKDHIFLAGESVEKQAVVINNSREEVRGECAWRLALPRPVEGRQGVTVPAGDQRRLALRLDLPRDLPPGAYGLRLETRFANGETQEDAATIDVLAPRTAPRAAGRIALFDPAGETARELARLGVRAASVGAAADLSAADVLIVGKAALDVNGPAPSLERVREGLKVLVFEQGSQALEKRLGLRTQEYGLRRVFRRVPDHPLLRGLGDAHLADWRGEATLLPPRLSYELHPQRGPTVEWCGLSVSRPWRCGNRGNVASVLIEKPARGDFLPIIDGGFSLQYAPLMEYREGKGVVVFCQMDVTGRTECEPAADALLANLVEYVCAWKPAPRRRVVYAGDPAGKGFLEAGGLAPAAWGQRPLAPSDVLVVGPGGGIDLRDKAVDVATWLGAGGHLLAVGLDERDARAFLPGEIGFRKDEYIASCFEPPPAGSLLAGVCPADVHNRDPRVMPLVASGADVLGDLPAPPAGGSAGGVLAQGRGAKIVFCQLAPWLMRARDQGNVRRTCRRASFLVNRLLANMGAGGETPLLERFGRPPDPGQKEQRWREGFYVDEPEEWDDPYRFFRW